MCPQFIGKLFIYVSVPVSMVTAIGIMATAHYAVTAFYAKTHKAKTDVDVLLFQP